MKTVEAALIGAGSRGFVEFGGFAKRFPHSLRFTAVADPDEGRRDAFGEAHGIPRERVFRDWRDLLARRQMADIIVNATPDRLHYPVTKAALEKGYHVFQEKPVASTLEDCLAIGELAKNSGRLVQIGHCLRFTPFYRTAREILASGKIGNPVTVNYEENVTFDHMAHSFVRGGYGIKAESSPMIVAKSCHDLDILVWMALGRRALRVSSFGSLTYYRGENAPEGAPERCSDGCPHEHECPFSAIRIYVKGDGPDIGYGGAQWQMSPSPNPAERMEALKTSPYGRCVFRCGNDVVDHQVANIEFEGGLTAAFTMQGFGAAYPPGEPPPFGRISGGVGRTFTVFGTKGTLRAPCYGQLEMTDFLLRQTLKLQTGFPEGGHGGGDYGMLHNFTEAVRSGRRDSLKTSVVESIMSHVIGFAAEESRLSGGRAIELEDFAAEAGRRNGKD
jgi:predicted dehydrogenase